MSSSEPPRKGRKRSRTEGSWERNVRKKLRNKGEEYVSKPGYVISAKQFEEVCACCMKKCHLNISVHQQETYFQYFWNLGDYFAQNVFLGMSIIRKTSKFPESNKFGERKLMLWEYSFHSPTMHTAVCRQFLLKLLQLHKSRFETVQRKIVCNNTLQDQRGKHRNQVVMLSDNVKQLIDLHCLRIPHSTSHYAREKSKLLYFENPNLTLIELYSLFLDYYTAITGKFKPPLNFSTYSKYFNLNLPYSFGQPRVDVCNFWYEYYQQIKNNENVSELEASLKDHTTAIQEYRKMKAEMKSFSNSLCLEFGFGQNLPLPKLPVTEQFYRRLWWLHIFNVHVYGEPKHSYMYTFLEGQLKKGANTVCNFLWHTIDEEIKLDCYNRIILFSDSCGGQNKNYLVLYFLLFLSKTFQVEVQHLYPVRGHSYCECDRNFAKYGRAKKRTETIETEDEYLKIISSARNPPFIIKKGADVKMKDFEFHLMSRRKIPADLHISKAVKMVYFPNGEVELFENYNKNPKKYVIELSTTIDDLINNPAQESYGISAEKMADVKSLYKYLSPRGRSFFDNAFEKITTKESKKVRAGQQKEVSDGKQNHSASSVTKRKNSAKIVKKIL